MAARAYWKGQIRLALASIPVEIYAATRSGSAISFRQIHESSVKQVKYEKVVPGIGPIDTADFVKDYEMSKGNYDLLDEEVDIEAVKLESKRSLEPLQFADAGDIDTLYSAKTCFVVPADELAGRLIDEKSGKFDASDFHNHYVDALKRVIAKKAKAKSKRVLEDVEEPGPVSGGSNVIGLMAALKPSVDSTKRVAADGAKAAPAKKTTANNALARKFAERKRA